MSDYHIAKTEETVEEGSTVSTENEQSEEGKESPTKNMHLQLTVDGDEESKEVIKGFETQESPQHSANENSGKWREYKTQESPVSKTSKDPVDWKQHRTEEDDSPVEVQGSVSGPPADFIGSKTVDDDLNPSAYDHRGMKTVEEDDDGYEPYQGNLFIFNSQSHAQVDSCFRVLAKERVYGKELWSSESLHHKCIVFK